MDGYEVVRLEDVVETADIFVTATGNIDIITAEHMTKMKHKAIVGNIGHFDNEIDMAGLAKAPGRQAHQHQAAGRRVGSSRDGHSIIVLAEGRLLNLGCATGHPSFVMSNSFTNQVIAQIELLQEPRKYEKQGLHAAEAARRGGRAAAPRQARGEADELSAEQAEYIGVPVEGPYKPDHYRY